MKISELNEYVNKYVRNDLTFGALMLVGPSAAGKSHYVFKELVPFLKNTKPSISCLQISLYGLKDLIEVSRTLFMENRSKLASKKNEMTAAGTILAKTVVKNLANYFKITLDADKEDLETLYSHADLSGKLVIFDDVEKMEIDPFQFYSYIYSLTKQDGVKVLLIVNNDDDNLQPPENVKTLLERTLSDIIVYKPHYDSIIQSVIKEFNHPILNSFVSETDMQDIKQCFKGQGHPRINTFYFACHKAIEIFNEMNTDSKEYDPDFLRTIFLGIVGYTAKKRAGKPVQWTDEDQFSYSLGSKKYPLFRFCYNYIAKRIYDPVQAAKAQALFKEYEAYDKDPFIAKDPDLSALSTWYYQKESDVKEALTKIGQRLQDPTDIPFQAYGKVARCMIDAGKVLGCDISEAKKLLVFNLYAQGLKIGSDYIIRDLIPDSDDQTETAYAELKEQMLDALKKVDTELLGFNYQPSQIRNFTRSTHDYREKILYFGAFARALDNRKIIEMLKQCSAKEIYDFCTAYAGVYDAPNRGAYLSGDQAAVNELLTLLRELKDYGGYDRIQKMDILDFMTKLEAIDLE